MTNTNNKNGRSKLAKLGRWLILITRAILFPLYKIPFVIIIILLGYYALAINDQGQDMMASFTAQPIWKNNYLMLFELFLLCWAISIWNVSRALLSAANLQKLVESEIKDTDITNANINHKNLLLAAKANNWVVASIDPEFKKVMTFMIKWTPRWLAMLPYIIFIYAYQQQSKAFNSSHWINIVAIIIIAFFHMLYMAYRKKLWYKFFKKPAFNATYNNADMYSLKEEKNFLLALKKSGIVINSILTVLMTVIMFLYALSAANDIPGAAGKPGLIILTGFTVYTLVGLILNLFINRFRIPVFILLVVFALTFASKYNNNHSVQILETAADKMMLNNRNKLTDFVYFDYWLTKKINNNILNPLKKQTIFIVAAEGGGIRNCYWTYKVLSELQKLDSNFYDRTFAVTGVSGGSIGLGFYYNYLYFSNSLQKGWLPPVDSVKLDSICSADYLSRVTFGFMFPDLIQRFIPAPIERWDRSKLLANSFDDGFSNYFNAENEEKYLNNNYLKMWADTSIAYKYPVLLFNTIFNEEGIKAIYSPYRLSDTYYANAMDLLYETNRCVPMKEAMVSSARFPILTAPGLIWHDTLNKDTEKPTKAKLGHISDGGGFENTGIQSAEQTSMLVQQCIKKRGLSNLSVKIIYIGTGRDSIEVPDKMPGNKKKYKTAINKAYEIAWLNGGVNTIFGWINGAHNISVRLNPSLSVLQFGLKTQTDDNPHKLPLGWYLSDTSRKILAMQATYANACNQFKTSIDTFKSIRDRANK
jgi:hypothetical protein